MDSDKSTINKLAIGFFDQNRKQIDMNFGLTYTIVANTLDLNIMEGLISKFQHLKFPANEI